MNLVILLLFVIYLIIFFVDGNEAQTLVYCQTVNIIILLNSVFCKCNQLWSCYFTPVPLKKNHAM